MVWILGPADQRLKLTATALAKETNSPIADSLPIRQVAALLSRCGAYVGNDSGVTHLAALSGVPTVAVFGPTDPAVWGPVGPNVRIIQAVPQCGPCTRASMNRCSRRICFETLSANTVEKELKKCYRRKDSLTS
jgi:ADP-heptose:LPS heptosyltransferase